MPRRSIFSPEFKILAGRVLLALAIMECAYQIFFWFPDNWQRIDRTRDLTVYFDAARRVKQGLSPYIPWPEFIPSLIPSRFFYPPPFLAVTRPLDGLDFVWFARVWSIILLAAFWVYAVALTKLATGRVTWRGVLIAKMCVDLCPDGYSALGLGNFEPVMWACYGIALTTRFKVAPLAFAAMMKLHPLWVLMMVVKSEGRRAFLTAAIVLGTGFALGIWICGWENSLQWWPSTSPVVSQGTAVWANVSLTFVPVRGLHALGLVSYDSPLPSWVRLYMSCMAIGAPLVTMFLTRKLPQQLRYGLVAAATILFSPLCWMAYLPLLLAPAAIWWRLKETEKAGAASTDAGVMNAPQGIQLAN